MNIFTLFGQISINNKDALLAIDRTSKKAKKLNDQMQHSFEMIGSAAVKCGKVIASGLAIGSAAMGVLLKATIGEYAEYEQLVGGVETLFKDSKDKVMEYASEAYKTAGLSANEYMSTVTSFSASLLQGLGGDTEAAAIIADKAITDMSDNANKMGTSMSSIQDAYQGFAKQNYTMLDNLKLGYGGTQEEMARLVNESGVLGAAIKVDAKTINNVSFDKIIEAIHIIQERMGITGATAKEASETISGSFASFKATWRNLVTGLSDGKSDIGALLATTLNAGETVWKNIKKVLPSLKGNILVALNDLAVYLDEKMGVVVWPKIQELFHVKFGIELPDWETLKTNLEKGWNNNIQPVLDGFKTSIEQVFEWLVTNGENVKSIVSGIALVFGGTWAIAHPLKTAILLLSGAFVTLNTDVTNTSDTLKNVKTFLEDLQSGINGVEPAVTAFFGSLGVVLVALKSKITLIIWAVSVVVANWEGLKAVIGLVAEAINDFFSITLPEWWADSVVKPVIEWWNNVTAAIDAAKQAVRDFFGSTKGETSVNVSGNGVSHGGGTGKGFANGLYRVPYDGFPAILHKDEAVLNRLDASEWRTANAYGGYVSDNSRLEAMMGNMVSLMQQMVANSGVGQNIVLDSGVLVGQLAPQMDMRLGTLSSRKGRGN